MLQEMKTKNAVAIEHGRILEKSNIHPLAHDLVRGKKKSIALKDFLNQMGFFVLICIH